MTIFRPSGRTEILKNEELTYEEFIDAFVNVFHIEDDLENKVERIINTLENYKCLIVIDNMETINNSDINNFLLRVPKNSKIIITSRENLENMTSPIVNLIGFEKNEFTEYFKQQLETFSESEQNIEKYLSNNDAINQLLEYTYGSPIIINMIAYQLANGHDLNSVLSTFGSSNNQNNLEIYEQVMDFCFNEIFSKLNRIDKSILYILSIPQSNDKKFSKEDLKFILKTVSLQIIQESVARLVKLSFVLKDDDLFYSPPLVKIFSNNKLSNSDLNITELGNQYAELNRHYDEIDEQQQYYFDYVKAYSEQDKIAAISMKESLDKFRLTNDFETVTQELKSLIKKHSNFARIYYELAQIKIEEDADENEIRRYFDLATEKDSRNDYYWTKYARFELSHSINKSHNREKAIQYFKNAITIDNKNYFAHHGLAFAMSRANSGKIEDEKLMKSIISSFENGFSNGTNKNHDCVNAHAYATFLNQQGKLIEAWNICDKIIKETGGNKALIALEGIIRQKLDPEFIGQNRIKRAKTGIMANQSDETIRRLIKIVDEKN